MPRSPRNCLRRTPKGVMLSLARARQRPSQQDVKCAGTTVFGLSRRESDEARTRRLLVEPARYGGTQYPALARNDENAALSSAISAGEERFERPMCLILGHAMEIKARLDRELTTLQPLGVATVEARRRPMSQHGQRRIGGVWPAWLRVTGATRCVGHWR